MSSQPGEATTFAELVVIHASDHGAATGSADARGWRPAMEDAVVVSRDAVPGAVTLAVFDGHGGVDVAKAAHLLTDSLLWRHALGDVADPGLHAAVLSASTEGVHSRRDRAGRRRGYLSQVCDETLLDARRSERAPRPLPLTT